MATPTFDPLIDELLLHDHLAGDITDLTAVLDPRYVNITGDTMTGALVITPSANGTSILNVTNQAGTSVFNVDTTNQRVGIGTTSPLSKFEVNGDVATLRIVDNVTRKPTLDLIRGTGAFGSDVYGDWRIQNNTAKLNFVNYASTSGERTYLTLDGSTSAATGVRIGINTATPIAPLDIEGTNFPVYRTVRNVTATTGFNSTNIFVTKTTGNAEDGLGGGLVFGFQDDTQVTDSYLASIGAVRDGGDTKGALVLFTYNGNPQERMRITNTGDVGIGTTAPAGRLHINGTANDEQLIVGAHSTQTANLVEFRNSSGAVRAYITGLGRIATETTSRPETISDLGDRLYVGVDETSAGITAYVRGAYVYSNWTSSNTFTGIIGLNAVAYRTGTGESFSTTKYGNMIGGRYAVRNLNATGTVATATGISAYVENGGVGGVVAGTITTAYGILSEGNEAGSGTIVNSYGVYIKDAVKESGSITNNYGIYIDSIDDGGTLNYAILTNAGNIVFNEGGDANTDFRVESDSYDALFVDASNNATYLMNNASGKLSFFGATPVTKQTELTDELTTITHTAPSTPDYAIQDLVDSSVGANFGFATKDEGNTVLLVIVNLQARVNELETKLTNYGLLVDAD